MMTEVLKLEIASICIVHIVAIILSIVSFMIFYMKVNKDSALKPFLVVQISMIGWMIFKIFKTVSPTVGARWWFIVAYYLCACILEAAFLEFGYSYYKGKSLPNEIRRFIYVLPILQFIIILTNPYHHLFYATYNFFGDSFGILFYLHTFIEYAFIAIGFVYCYKTFKVRFRNKSKWYKYFISSAIVIPLMLNFLYITKVVHRVVSALGIPIIFDITPIVFTWSIMVFVYATFNSDFFSLSPILKHEIVHKLDTSICVLDSGLDVVYVNEKLEELFHGKGQIMIEKILTKKDFRKIKSTEVQIETYYVKLHVSQVSTFLETQYILTIKDISAYKNIEIELSKRQEELDYSNKELKTTINSLKETSKIGARNYVARELHDIIGHSLVVTIKLLEVARLYFKKDKLLSVSAVADALMSIDTGIGDMNAIKKGHILNTIYTGESLKKELLKMLNAIKNIDLKTKLHFKGALYGMEEKTFDIIKKVCTELVTNSLKHGQAKEIFISVNIKKNDISILVMDNGVGCHHLIKGNGLKGVQDRLALIDGKVEFITSVCEGFMSKIYIKA